jgi:hypothetical protein
MNTTKLRVIGIAVAFIALMVGSVWQQQRAARLMAEVRAARMQANWNVALREENQRLVGQLQLLSERSQADANELPRLRGQAARVREVEQENVHLRADRDHLTKQMGAVAALSEEHDATETPLVLRQRAKGFFGRDLGMALIRAAEANGGNLPSELRGPLFETVEDLSAARTYDIRARHFELVYAGSLRDVKDVSETVLAREKEPVQLADGKWMRLYVMADGSSRYLSADAADAFSASERNLWPAQTQP